MSDYISKSALIKALKNHPNVLEQFGHIESIGLENVVETINSQPTLDETEIIRKAFEKVLQRLEDRETELRSYYEIDMCSGLLEAIDIVKKECGIND